MLRISLGSLGDEYMPCSSTCIHLLLTIISLQLSASLFFLYSVFKVHLRWARRVSQRYFYLPISRGHTVPHAFGCLSRRSAGHHCSQSFPLVRVVPRRQPLVGSSGLEPPTSRLSGVRSNHLSYEPIFRGRLWFAFPAYLFPRCSLPAFLRPRATTVPSRFPSFASCLQRSWWWR